MARPEPTTVLTALGFSPAVERLYQEVLRRSGHPLSSVAAAVAVEPDALRAGLAPLIDRGIVRLEGDVVHVEGPAQALARLVVEQSEAASRSQADLLALARAVPLLVAGAARPAEGEVERVVPLDGEISSGGNPALLIASLLRESVGNLVWLRPDQWRIGPERERAMVEAIRDLVASGRTSRAIYPVRVLQEAPDVVRSRAAAGEEIRLLPDLPTRMFVIGTTHAVLPEPLGFVDEPRMLVRQQGLVEALLLLFECLWDRASPLLDAERAVVVPALRQFVVQQLAAGARDEQIARQLGTSLRTVRRRISELMEELGVDSRFQAGVEAARRGWI